MTEPFALQPDGGKAIPFIGLVKVSADRSAGALEVIEYRGPATPPPHIHREHDECFTLLQGRFGRFRASRNPSRFHCGTRLARVARDRPCRTPRILRGSRRGPRRGSLG